MVDIEKAIAVIQAQPDQRASSALLHNALGMTDTDAPSKRLAEGLADGRLVKEGKYWTVGAATPGLPKAAISEAQPAVAAQQPAPLAPRSKTKVQVVIDFLIENGKSDTESLRKVLGIVDKSKHPINYLQDAVHGGRIHRSGNTWWVSGYEAVKYPPVGLEIPRLATGAIVAEAPPVVSQTETIVSDDSDSVTETANFVTPEPSSVTAKPEAQTTIRDNEPDEPIREQRRVPSLLAQRHKTVSEPGQSESSDFVAALLSNGDLELRLDGKSITLSLSEWKHMREFINKVELA